MDSTLKQIKHVMYPVMSLDSTLKQIKHVMYPVMSLDSTLKQIKHVMYPVMSLDNTIKQIKLVMYTVMYSYYNPWNLWIAHNSIKKTVFTVSPPKLFRKAE